MIDYNYFGFYYDTMIRYISKTNIYLFIYFKHEPNYIDFADNKSQENIIQSNDNYQ